MRHTTRVLCCIDIAELVICNCWHSKVVFVCTCRLLDVFFCFSCLAGILGNLARHQSRVLRATGNQESLNVYFNV